MNCALDNLPGNALLKADASLPVNHRFTLHASLNYGYLDDAAINILFGQIGTGQKIPLLLKISGHLVGQRLKFLKT